MVALQWISTLHKHHNLATSVAAHIQLVMDASADHHVHAILTTDSCKPVMG